MSQAKILQVNSVKFHSNQDKIIAQIDGEAVTLNQKIVEVSVLTNALNVITPN